MLALRVTHKVVRAPNPSNRSSGMAVKSLKRRLLRRRDDRNNGAKQKIKRGREAYK